MFLHYLSMAGAAVFMIFFFGLCIFIHELGHFLVARWRGLHVDAFSIGFKKVWGWKRGGIEYRIGCIPFGGYVEIPQIDASGEAKTADGRALPKAKPFDRILAVFAGPFSNLLFGLFLGLFIWWFGLPQDTPKMRSFEIAEIEESSPEYKAGLRVGDEVYRVNGESFNDTWNGVVRKILFAVGDVTLDYRRDGKPMQVKYFPAVNKGVMPEEEIPYPYFRPKIPVVLYPEPGSLAEKAGIKAGDKVLKFNGKEVFDLDSFERDVYYSGSKPIALTVLRDEKPVELPPFMSEPLDAPKPVYQMGVMLGGSSPVRILGVVPGAPAEAAGLKKDDEVLAIDGKPVAKSADFISAVQGGEGRELKIGLRRGGALLELSVKPALLHQITGVQYAFFDHPNPFEQFGSACALTYKSLRGVFVRLGNQLGLTEKQSNLKPRHFSGPIGIGNYLFRAVYYGSFIIGLNIVVIITFNLALVNLLPLPVLDGGHIVIAIYEMIVGSPPPQRLLQPLTMAFVALLISFMLFVSFYDLKRVLPWAFRASKPALEAPASPSAEPASVKNAEPANAASKPEASKGADETSAKGKD